MIPKIYKRLQQELERLPSIQGYMTNRRHPSFYFDRVRRVLGLLGNPEREFRFVHIGGTSGKGSTTMLIHSMLHAAGRRVGSNLSPHVTTLVERIMINGRPVSPADLWWAWTQMQPALRKIRTLGKDYLPSYFEALVVMSFLLFKKYRVEWVALEVGCGGEFDATNVIPPPDVAVITSIGLDHTNILGRTRKLIARTKAGIIKHGSYVITGEGDAAIRKILCARAQRMRTPYLYVPLPSWRHKTFQGKTIFRMPNGKTISTPLIGEHQIHNIALAMAVARHMKLPLSAVIRGIRTTKLPARTEYVQNDPDVIIDGAHNPDKIKALVRVIRNIPHKRLHAIVGIGHAKPVRQIIRELGKITHAFTFTQAPIDQPAPEPAESLLRIAKKLFPSKPMCIVKDPKRAARSVMKQNARDTLIVVTGSLYLAGVVRELWFPEERILATRSLFPRA